MDEVNKRIGFFKRHMRLTLVFLYAAVVFAPGIVLGALALRALDREEAYVEKTLENSLLTEVNQTVTAVRGALEAAREELSGALVFPGPGLAFRSAPLRSSDLPLAETVFVLTRRKELLWPNAAAPLNEHEKEFLYWNSPLMTDRVKVPVVKNIVMEYQEQIINFPETNTAKRKNAGIAQADTKAFAAAETGAGNTLGDDEANEPPAPKSNDGWFANADKTAARDRASLQNAASAETETAGEEDRAAAPRKSALEEEQQKRTAVSRFEKSRPIQEEIYKQAEKEGKEVLTRNITPVAKSDSAKDGERSLFIVSTGTFSDIIAAGEDGFLPRFLGDKFSLLYWKKNQGGDVVGAVVNLDALKERMLKVMPAESAAGRVHVVLDDQGRPLHAPDGLAVDWKAPFVAREIHEALPRWEAASYLADPGLVAARAEATTSVLWVLTAFLLLAIVGGGIILIRLLLSELALAQKKTNLVTNVSHELKTPLTSIRLFAEMLMENVAPGPAKRREYCSLLLSETERLSRLINNVLDFSKMSQGRKRYQKAEIELVALCRDVVTCERVRLEQAGIALSFSADVKKAPFFGCRESFARVIVNLVSNAEKYAAAGGRIDIELSARGPGITLRVMDRGPGIPAWAAKKIFREFFRVDDSLTARTAGSGLGLTISRMIVVDHGGTIEYAPRPGGGSVFLIRLPKERNNHG